MTVARTLHLPRPSSSSGIPARLGDAARALLVAAVTALMLVGMGSAAYSWGGLAGGNPDPTQWTD
jgi:hypothetical protein